MEMTGSSFALNPHVQDAATVAPSAEPAKPAHHFSFDDFLDIVNPLQHLPVVGTLYRAFSGDKIGTAEKIVGDGIYGGVWGLVSSVADAGFEAATGKNFGDTVLSFLTGHHEAPTAVATQAAKPPAVATPVDRRQALAAYRRMSMPGYAG
ncbi:MAG TPA: hypothetical protein VG889_15650 [Rhizomicrobium sp.]|nr:hypothetical protein [Rhizomicrobium sp.]